MTELNYPIEEQTAEAVLMIRPRHFAGNAETRESNRFQTAHDDDACSPGFPAVPQTAARAELDALAAALRSVGITVNVLEGRDTPRCPDEVFPNNWLSTHADGSIVLYPMMAPSRRRERRTDIADALHDLGYAVERVVDLSELEQRDQFVEGTGSVVLDRRARVAYACVSPRTSPQAVAVFAERLGYETVLLDARDPQGHPIYHTNVMMSVGSQHAVVCFDAIGNSADRKRVRERLTDGGKEIIEIGFEQMAAFAGNLLELRGPQGPVIALSARALGSLEAAQRRRLAAHGELVSADVGTIEAYGGGSVRCMLAEVHLPKRAAARRL